jgi:hypothetical protein
MTLEGFIVIAATAWVYAKVGKRLVNEMKKQERSNIASRGQKEATS